MSDSIINQYFNNSSLILEMRFVGDNYETASVQFKLEARDGRPVLEESVTIPVKRLFDMTFLIGMCLRRTALQYEIEVEEMKKRIEEGKHPLKPNGEKKHGKEN